MDGQHLDAEFARGADRPGDRVRNIVQLEIEKNFCARRRDGADDFRPRRRVKLQTDFVDGNRV